MNYILIIMIIILCLTGLAFLIKVVTVIAGEIAVQTENKSNTKDGEL